MGKISWKIPILVVSLSAVLPVVFNSCESKKVESVDLPALTMSCAEHEQMYSLDQLQQQREQVRGKYCEGWSSSKLSKAGAASPFNSFSDSKINLGQAAAGFKIQQQGLQAGDSLTFIISSQCSAPTQLYRELSENVEFANGLKWQVVGKSLSQPMSYNELQDEVNADACVMGVTTNNEFELSYALNDELVKQGKAQHLDHVFAKKAFDHFYHPEYGIKSSAKSVVVGVVDSGVSSTHPDLADNIYSFPLENGEVGKGYDVTAAQGSSAYYQGQDISGHGTHVSGLIAGIQNDIGTVGLAHRRTKIFNLKVFYEASQGRYVSSAAYVLQALQVAICNNIDVINLSLQGQSGINPQDPLYEEMLQDAVNSGITVVTVAGNSSSEHPQQELMDSQFNIIPSRYAADLDGMMSVAALNQAGNELASYSHYSSKYAEIAAPGTDIWSSIYFSGSGQNGYDKKSGTSMAAPLVSGAAALSINLLRSHGYFPTPRLIEELITTSGVVNAALEGKVKGAKQLNLYNLIQDIHRRFPKTAGRATCSP